MTTVTELKKLFIELGGNPEDLKGCQTDADVIKLLSEVVGSTIELPAVSGTDNGKVLKVIEGAWGKGTDEALPEVTAEDNGSVLKVVEGAWGKVPPSGFEIKKKSYVDHSPFISVEGLHLLQDIPNAVVLGIYLPVDLNPDLYPSENSAYWKISEYKDGSPLIQFFKAAQDVLIKGTVSFDIYYI